MSAAHSEPDLDLGQVRDWNLDPWQWRLTDPQSDLAAAAGAPVGPLRLRVGPDIVAAPVFEAGGAQVGWVLGFPVDLDDKRLVTDALRLTIPLGPDPDSFAEDVLTRIGGRFLLIMNAGGKRRIYLDSGGQVPCVFDPAMQAAASTAHALLTDAEYDRRFNAERFDTLGVANYGWFPAGLTAHDGVERLLAHHYLDLDSWTVHRHWPLRGFPQTTDPDAEIEKIIAKVRDQLEAFVAGDKKVGLALTAGHETRMLLGIARPFRSQVCCLTVVGSDRHSTDSIIARRIARAENLEHVELPRVMSTEAAREVFIRRSGHCVVDSNSLYFPSVHPIARSHVFLGGLGGELGRAFLWRDSDTPSTKITADLLMSRLGLPEEPELKARLSRWLDDVPTDNALEILDLAYIEQRMCPWSSAQFYSDPTLVRQAPLFTRDIADAMLSLPGEWKRGKLMSRASIRRTWPELERFPFNSLGKIRSAVAKLQRVAGEPRLILRFLRKRMG